MTATAGVQGQDRSSGYVQGRIAPSTGSGERARRLGRLSVLAGSGPFVASFLVFALANVPSLAFQMCLALVVVVLMFGGPVAAIVLGRRARLEARRGLSAPPGVGLPGAQRIPGDTPGTGGLVLGILGLLLLAFSVLYGMGCGANGGC